MTPVKSKQYYIGNNPRLSLRFAMTLLMTFMLSTVSFATNLTLAQQLQQRLITLGIPNTYTGNIVEYLQKIKINEDQFKSINAKIDEAVALSNGATDISIIDEEVKSKIKNLASESASILGLRLTFGKDSKGVTTATILDANGNNILSLNTFNVIDLVQNIDTNEIKEVVIIITEFSNNPEKNKFDPISGELNKTGTNLGNVMAVGFGLIALSGAIFITSKRVVV